MKLMKKLKKNFRGNINTGSIPASKAFESAEADALKKGNKKALSTSGEGPGIPFCRITTIGLVSD
jgi:hypothetical protein